jgi:hypothetical protein
MKVKRVATIIILVICLTPVFAQDDTYDAYQPKRHYFWIGPKFGSTFTGFPTNFTKVGDRLKDVWQVGVLTQFGRVLYLQPEAYYLQTNIRNENGIIVSSNAMIKIPAMLGLRFINLGLFSLHLTGGPQWSMPLYKDETTSGTSLNWLVGAGIDILGFITTDVRLCFDPDVKINEQINHFNFNSTPLSITVGFKFR